MDTVDTHNIMDIVIVIAPLNEQQTEALAVNSLGAKKLCTPAPITHPIPVGSSFRDGITTPFFFFLVSKHHMWHIARAQLFFSV